MSGHSKFANIKHKKEKNDAAKGKIFTMIGRELAVAVKEGGPDPANNFKLAQVVAKAKANNMPNDTIERDGNGERCWKCELCAGKKSVLVFASKTCRQPNWKRGKQKANWRGLWKRFGKRAR